MKKIFIILVIAIASIVQAAEIKKATENNKIIDLSTQESKVEFLAVGKPSMLKINGSGGKLKGILEVNSTNVISGDLIVLLAPLTTGIDLRDTHMKEKYLEVSKFPEASLTITELKLPENVFKVSTKLKDIDFKGKLKIHGIENDITGKADIDSTTDNVVVIAKTNTTISAHKIDIPSYLGIKVADAVQINAELQIKK